MSVTAIATSTCLLCGATAAHPMQYEGLLQHCTSCGFCWTVDQPIPVTQLYGPEYYHDEGYQQYFESATARRRESALRLAWVQRHARPRSLLEAGCAGGYFLAAARAAGISVAGVEVSQVATDFARDELGLPVQQGEFEQVRPTDTFEAVAAFHVLEHVADPQAFLATAYWALAPGGTLFLEVPNFDSAASHRLRHQWPALATRYHRWHFTPETLTAMVAAAGFADSTTDTVFSRFYWGPVARWRHPRSLLLADAVAARSPRVAHPRLGDMLRLVATKPHVDLR